MIKSCDNASLAFRLCVQEKPTILPALYDILPISAMPFNLPALSSLTCLSRDALAFRIAGISRSRRRRLSICMARQLASEPPRGSGVRERRPSKPWRRFGSGEEADKCLWAAGTGEPLCNALDKVLRVRTNTGQMVTGDRTPPAFGPPRL
jgi:hypothetical protein